MLPSESSLCTGAQLEPAQLSYVKGDAPGGTSGLAPQRSTTQMERPSLSTATPFSAPHLCPSGSLPQGAALRYGLGRSLVGVPGRAPVRRPPLAPPRGLAPGCGAAVRARQVVGGRAVPFPRRGRASRDQPENQGQTPFILYREQDQLTHGSLHRVGLGFADLIVSETNRQQHENWEDTRGAQNGSLGGSDMKDYAEERARAIRRANRMRAMVIRAFTRKARGALAKAAHDASVSFYEAAGVRIRGQSPNLFTRT